MFAADGAPPAEHRLELGGAGCVGTGPTGSSVAQDADAGRAAILLGRPRWHHAEVAADGRDHGHAAAALRRYAAVGERILEELQGSFALVLIDLRAGTALLAVDRTGIERLCFARVGPLLVFSTSARAVAAHPGVRAGLSRQALFEYLYCHMVPSPDTVFEGIEKLLPAQRLVATADRAAREFYWSLQFASDTRADEQDQERTFRQLLRQSVERQLDHVPAGAFLSGGTDSSTVTGMLGEISGQAPRTFSIGFDAEGFDELDYARITARHFGADATEFYVTPEHVAEALPLIASAYDEPFGNASAVPTYFCARIAREHGITAMLAGDGGDEFFGGNVRYAKQGIFEHYQAVPYTLRRVLEPLVFGFPFGSALLPVRKAQSYIRQATVPLPDRLETYNFLSRDALADIFEPEFIAGIDTERPLALMREAYFRAGSHKPVDRMMRLDHKVTLADNDLRKVSRMCEAAGVEVRFPFLDEDLIAFSGTLSVRQKVSGARLRVFFKQALRDFLPGETITKSKHGFGLPFGLWLAADGPLRSQAVAALDSLARRGIIRPDYLRKLWREHSSGHASYYGVMIWVLTQLELWLQRNGGPADH
ncbi:asparagine synthase-related protein [Aromatoleum toluolicum]|uniref:asparagine synthase (glutamine-hydrolyzing) n=1 Tax=Aromatoleum toluolicum TaxID=90060 RepID=A0ABX1NC11_9RHOO|nr:asparagine synthase C-terminal domain-containing protein [Aromatoleum toluolicum]NMF96740.1 asparagine synthase-related protein [Aromatoleum toluolicum]